MLSSQRANFFDILARYYEDYGIPALCGWIDALLALEQKEEGWTQKAISKRLSYLFPNSDTPTSVSSVNRAIKINEKYGTIIKRGNRKTGYTYFLTTEPDLIVKMFQRFIVLNDRMIHDLELLKKNDIVNDESLKEAIEFEITGMTVYNLILQRASKLASGSELSKLISKMKKNSF